jgi:hypothetical protein
VTFRSLALPRFWDLYDRLPVEIQAQADKQFALFSKNPSHPSLRFKQVGPFWSVRVSYSYRALAVRNLVLDRHARRLRQVTGVVRHLTAVVMPPSPAFTESAKRESAAPT